MAVCFPGKDCLTSSVFSEMTTLLQSLPLHLRFMFRIHRDHVILGIKKQASIGLLLLPSEAQTIISFKFYCHYYSEYMYI